MLRSINKKGLHNLLFMCVIISSLQCLMAAEVHARSEAEIFRGISLTLNEKFTNDDLEKISSWGSNLIRLTIHANPKHRKYGGFYNLDNKTINPAAFKKIDQFLINAKLNNLKVLIDIHSHLGGAKIWEDYQYWNTLNKLCAFMANRYKQNDTLIGFAPINEAILVKRHGSKADIIQMRSGIWNFPSKWRNTPQDYFGLVEKVGQTINQIAPSKFILVAGIGLYANPLNYQWMETVSVKNAVYAFNMYKPQKFGDSGKQGRPIVSYDRKNNYPKMTKIMDHVRKFSDTNNVPVFVSAFGLPYHTEGMGAKQWMEDVISYFENNRWSWAYWSYTIPFRNPEVVNIKNSIKKLDSNSERLTVLKKYWSRNTKFTKHVKM